jgi:hypothetical protein
VGGDYELDVIVERGVEAEDERPQDRARGQYFAASLGSFGPVVWTRPAALSVLCRYRHSTDYAGRWIMPMSE